MKVVIQNGALRTLTRKQAEAIVALLPPSWSEHVHTLTLYQGSQASLEVKHYPQNRTIGVFWPAPSHPQPTSVEAAKELLVAMAVVVDRGALPGKLGKAIRSHAEQQVSELLSEFAASLDRGDA